MANLPLDGIRVLDLTTVLMGPYATQILGDYGADVVKVEPPEGDPVRGIGPMRNRGMGAIFLHANRNKRSLVLDLKRPEGRAVLLDLARTADVLAYNLRPHSMEKLGLGYEALRAANPAIIYLGMFGFARAGRYAQRPAYDDLIQGLSGIASLFLRAGAATPRYVPMVIADRGTALQAVNAVLAALVHRLRTGRGQAVDVTMFEAMTRLTLADHLQGETFVPPIGGTVYGRLVAPDRRPVATKDGWLCVLVYTDKQWRSFFRALGREAEFDADPRLSNITLRNENIEALYALVASIMAGRTTAEWLELLERADVPAMPLLAVDELARDPHLVESGFIRELDHPSEGRVRQITDGTWWSDSPPAIRRLAPRLGEHSAEVLREAGYDTERIARLAEQRVIAAAGPHSRPKEA